MFQLKKTGKKGEFSIEFQLCGHYSPTVIMIQSKSKTDAYHRICENAFEFLKCSRDILHKEVLKMKPYFFNRNMVPYLGNYSAWHYTYWQLLEFFDELEELEYLPFQYAKKVLREFHLIEKIDPFHNPFNQIEYDIVTKDIKEVSTLLWLQMKKHFEEKEHLQIAS